MKNTRSRRSTEDVNVQLSVGASLTIRTSSVMINSEGLLSVCLLWGRVGPKLNTPLSLSRRDSLLGCLFIFTPVTDPEQESERYFRPPGAGGAQKLNKKINTYIYIYKAFCFFSPNSLVVWSQSQKNPPNNLTCVI